MGAVPWQESVPNGSGKVRWTILHVPLRDLTAGETYTRRPNEIGTHILQSAHSLLAKPTALPIVFVIYLLSTSHGRRRGAFRRLPSPLSLLVLQAGDPRGGGPPAPPVGAR